MHNQCWIKNLFLYIFLLKTRRDFENISNSDRQWSVHTPYSNPAFTSRHAFDVFIYRWLKEHTLCSHTSFSCIIRTFKTSASCITLSYDTSFKHLNRRNSNELLFRSWGVERSQKCLHSNTFSICRDFAMFLYRTVAKSSESPLWIFTESKGRFAYDKRFRRIRIRRINSSVRLRCCVSVHIHTQYVCLFGPNLYSAGGRRTHAE